MNTQLCLQEDNEEIECSMEASVYGDIKEKPKLENVQVKSTEFEPCTPEVKVQEKKGKTIKKKTSKKNRSKNKVNSSKKNIKNDFNNEICLIEKNFIGKKRHIKKGFSYYFPKKSKNKLNFNSDNNNTPIIINGSTDSSIIHLCQNSINDTGQNKRFENENLNELFLPKEDESDFYDFSTISIVEYNQDYKIIK